jgi:hypothetical protein
VFDPDTKTNTTMIPKLTKWATYNQPTKIMTAEFAHQPGTVAVDTVISMHPLSTAVPNTSMATKIAFITNISIMQPSYNDPIPAVPVLTTRTMTMLYTTAHVKHTNTNTINHTPNTYTQPAHNKSTRTFFVTNTAE